MVEGLSTTKISYEAGKRPKKAKRSGSGNHCCVPNCKSTQYKCITIQRPRLKQALFFFSFSKNSIKKKGMASKHIQIWTKRRERCKQCTQIMHTNIQCK